MEELVTIAKIVKTRGLKGELVADLLTDFPQRFEGLESVTAVRPDGSMLSLNLDDFWFQNGRVILRFAGYGRSSWPRRCGALRYASPRPRRSRSMTASFTIGNCKAVVLKPWTGPRSVLLPN
ncbi:MAG: hypothetical protein IPP63_05690 [Chloracidobacterium sp.]|nr:hypothetical protein [Chloracidobacterium sp.]